jgi:hypothetical protein
MDKAAVVALIVGNAPRFLIVLIYLSVTVMAVIRRAQLGAATVPAVLGSISLALANALAIAIYFWQVTVALSGREALRQFTSVELPITHLAEALAVIGAALLALAIFSGRSPQAATPNNRWRGP